MNLELANLQMQTEAIKPVPKWIVVHATQTRRLRGDRGEWLYPGTTFHGDWIVAGWVKMLDRQRWVKVADCEKQSDDPVTPSPDADPNSDALVWMKPDYELYGTKWERKRPNLPGYPQTVNLSCRSKGVLPASDDYIRIVLELNPGMDFEKFTRMMDSWNAGKDKWRDGERKVPSEIVFASNTYAVRAHIRNGGGLLGIPKNAWVYEIDTLPWEALDQFTAETIPVKYIMHLTLAKKDRREVDPSPAMGGRGTPPYLPVRLPITSLVPMYIREEFVSKTSMFRNPYNPEWDWGGETP